MPFANPVNIANMTGIFGYVNSVTDSAFVPLMLFSIWFVLFLVLKVWNTESALGSSTFIVMLLAMLFRAANLVSDTVVIITVVAFLISAVLIVIQRENPA